MSLRSYISAALLFAGAALGQRSCNGSPELCGRKYSNVTFVGAHDSAFVGFLPVDNQYLPLDQQMALGVRYLQSQTHKKDGNIEMCHTSCIELDAGSFADYIKPVKAFLDANPNEVITMLVTNPDSIAVEKYGDAFKAAGLDGYAFTPDSKLAMGDWPTLGQLIDSGKRLVVFMDYHSDTSKVPYILDEFAYYFETPWGWTDPAFAQCDLDRPDGASPDGRMYIVNHMLNVELDLLGFKILIPDQEHAEQTNSVMSIIAQSDLCITKYGRTPNVVLLDWVNKGDAMGSQLFPPTRGNSRPEATPSGLGSVPTAKTRSNGAVIPDRHRLDAVTTLDTDTAPASKLHSDHRTSSPPHRTGYLQTHRSARFWRTDNAMAVEHDSDNDSEKTDVEPSQPASLRRAGEASRLVYDVDEIPGYHADGPDDDDPLPMADSLSASRRASGASERQPEVVAWRDLPRKKQLLVIVLARLSEPLVQTSIQSYMFYQLKWFDETLPDSVIASQAGVLHASFTAAQFFTAMLWGRLADSSRVGRKSVILIGLLGTMISCLGFGFSTSFWQALVFRSFGGITNGNVGVMRTMISETIREKKYQSRAFLLLPMTFNIGVIIGPILGGILSDPAGSYPNVFGKVKFFRKFPYAAPNLLSAFFLLSACLAVWLCLEETLDARSDKGDMGLELGTKISSLLARLFRRGRLPTGLHASVSYTPVASRDASTDVELSPATTAHHDHLLSKHRPRYTQRLPLTRIFTPNVVATFASLFLLGFHVGTFNSLWFVFLSTPVYDPAAPPPPGALPRHLPFLFTGGLGLPPRSVGLAMAILGVLGIALQLLVYPSLSARLGTVRSLRLFLVCFPATYFLVPYLGLVPSDAAHPPPGPKGGAPVWLAIAGVLFCQVLARTFAMPAQTILVNNCTPHPSVLGTVHGLAQSVASFARTVGPVMCGFLYGLGLEKGVIGAVWWGLSGVAVCGLVASWWVREGDGHEIWLEGDYDGEDEAEEEEGEHGMVARNRV